MAGGAYKGLTIRIGGDVTKLTSSLRGADSAIFKTQSGLNKLSKAAKLDPGNTGVINAQLGAMAEQAINTAAKMDVLREGIKALGDTPLQGDSSRKISDLAKDTDSLTLAAERAKVAYDGVNAKLNELYTKIKDETGGAVDIRKVTNAGEFSEDWLRRQQGLTEEQKNEVMALKGEWTKASQALEDYSDAAKLQSLSQDLVAQEAKINSLNNQIVETSRSMATFDQYKSGLFSGLGKNLEPINRQLALVTAAADTASERFSSLDSSLSLDYGGMDVMTERTDALNNAIEATEMKARLLEERIQAYEDAGVGRLVEDMGNVAMEVEQSEKAFKDANRDLEMLKASGKGTSDELKGLEAAADAARQRMDTAHACQQYQNLKAQLHEASSEAVSLANKLVDVSRPSSIASSSSVRKLSSELEYVGKSIQSVESDANSLNSAIKLNPEGVDAVQRKAELLAEATRLAAKEGEDLKAKLGSYDLTAIEAATDSAKTAAEQVLDAADNFEQANEKVRDTETAMSELQRTLDSIDLNKASEDDLETWNILNDSMLMLIEQLHEEKAAAQEAGEALDLSKQREEVEQLQTKEVQNIATVERLAASSRALSLINATPRFDTSFADAMRAAFEEMSSGRMADQSMGAVADKLADVASGADDAYERFQRLDSAMDIQPNSLDTAQQRAKALVDAVDATNREIDTLRQGMDAIPADKIDHASIAQGTVAQRVSETSRSYDEATKRAEGYQQTINALTAELRKLESQDAIGEKDAADIENLKASIEALTESANSFKEANQQAFDDMNVATATQKYQELSDRLVDATGRARELNDAVGKLQVRSDIAPSLKAAQDELQVIQTATETASERFAKLSQAAEIRPYSISVAVERVKALREATDAAQKKADNLRQQLEKYKASGIDKIAAGTKDAALQFELAQKKVNDLSTKLERVKKEFGENSTEAQKLKAALDQAFKEAKTAAAVNECKNLQAELRATEADAQSMKSSLRGAFEGVGTAAVQAAQQVGQYMQQAGRAIVEASNDIDSSYRDLRKTFDAEEADYERLYDAAMKYSQSHVTSADQMLEMESIAGQLGVGLEGGADAIQKFAEVASNLDVATNIDADTIALQMGQVMNVMSDLDTTNVDKFGDALVRLGNNMPTQESNIMAITQRLAAVGDVAGFSTPELMGWAAAIAGTGQKSEAAATAISNTITAIQKAVGKGGEDVELFAQTAGMSADQFVAAWKSKPTEALKAFVGGLSVLGDESLQRLEDLEITGVRQTQTLLALAQTVDTVGDSITMASDAFNGVGDQWGAAGDAAREAELKAAGFSGTLSKMKNSAQVLAATLGDAMVPFMQQATVAIQSLTEWVNGLDDGTKSLIVTVGGAFAAFAVIEPVVAALGGHLATLAGGVIRGVVTTFGELGAAISLIGGGAGVIETLGALFGGGGILATLSGAAVPALAIAGVTALVGAIAKYGIEASVAKQKADRLAESQKGLKQAHEWLIGSVNGATKEIKNEGDAASTLTSTFDDVADTYDRLAQRERNLADARSASTVEQRNMERELKQAQDIIDQYANKTNLSADAQWQLQDAIATVNEKCGTSYEVVDAANGVIKEQGEDAVVTADQLDKLIQKQLELAKIEGLKSAISSSYADLYKSQAEQTEYENNLDLAKAEVDKARSEWQNYRQKRDEVGYDTFHEQELYNNYEKANEQVANYKNQLDATTDSIDKQQDALKTMEDQLFGLQREAYTVEGNFDEVFRTMFGQTLEEGSDEWNHLAHNIQLSGIRLDELQELAKSPELASQIATAAGGSMKELLDVLSTDDALSLMKDSGLKTALSFYGGLDEGTREQFSDYDASITHLCGRLNEMMTKNLSETGSVSSSLLTEMLLQGIREGSVTAEDEAGVMADNIRARLESMRPEGLSDAVWAEVLSSSNSIDELRANLELLEKGEYKPKVDVEVDDSEVDPAKEKIEGLPDEKDINVGVEDDTQPIDEVSDKVNSLPDNVDIGITSNAESAVAGAEVATEAVNGVPDRKDITVDSEVDVQPVDNLKEKLDTFDEARTAVLDVDVSKLLAGAQLATKTLDLAAKTRTAVLNMQSNLGKAADTNKDVTVKGTVSMDSSSIDKTAAKAKSQLDNKYYHQTVTVSLSGMSTVTYQLAQLAGIKTIGTRYIDVKTRVVGSASAAALSSGVTTANRATGGFFGRPNWLASGGIVNAPGVGYPLNMVGEAGAEAVVPLTNRRYARPFADIIAESVAKNGGSGGNTYIINGVSYLPGSEIASHVEGIFDAAMRGERMG